jgi:predicted trehalose synthase
MSDSSLLPDDATYRHLLLDLYVVVKAMYEVRYELANRPGWVAWPMSAIAGLLREGAR